MKQIGMSLLAACMLTPALVSPAGADSAARRLVGTWTIQNETADQTYSGATATGEVTFAEDQTLKIQSGGFAAAGIVHPQERAICYRPQAPVSFKVLGTGAKQKLYVSWTGKARKAPDIQAPQDALIDVVKLGKNEAILVGRGGCGAVGASRVSYLTRVR